MTGADPSNYGGDDWLALSVANGGSIRLSILRQVTGLKRFVLGEGTGLDLTNLTQLADGCRIDFGPNSTVSAPNLTAFVNNDLSLGAGSTFTVPPFTNIYASRLGTGLAAARGSSWLQNGAPPCQHCARRVKSSP